MSELTALGSSSWNSGDLAAYPRGLVLVDRYELVREIGRGGTAVVWVARDSVLDIEVAAKIVLPCSEDFSGELKQRTVLEARLCAQLTDPAVCRVLDFGFTHRGDPFVVSELLEGETLDDRLVREGRLAEDEAVRLLLPILDALGAAHRKGIVHRDVKPGNVFLANADGRVQPKLLDFGIACSSDISCRTTSTGNICGTPCYMSPEQARGSGDIDARSDLWSFSVMLYEMVSGTAPFLGDNYHATLFAIASQSVPPLSSFGCDERLSKMVERGMEKERDARWSSAAELADALSRWLVDRGFESDAYGLSLRRRFLDGLTPAAFVEDVSSTRGVTLFSGHRARQRGAHRSGSKAWLAPALVGLGTAVAVAGVVFARGLPRPEAPEPLPAAMVAAPPATTVRAVPAPDLVPASTRADAPRVQPVPSSSVVEPPHASPPPRVKVAPQPAVSAPPSASAEPVPPTVTSAPPAPATKAPPKARPLPSNALRYDFGI